MRKIIQYLVILVLGVLTACSFTEKSEIISTNNDEYVENILKEADPNTLVIFDSDFVLIAPKDALYYPNNSEICKKIISYLRNKIGKEAADDLFIEMRKQYPIKLVNKNFPNIIQNLQAKGVRVLLLTSHWAGNWRNIERVEDTRKAELTHLNFDFKKSWLDCPNFIFYDLSKVRDGIKLHPKLDDGMIFGCKIEKGVVLSYFLKHVPMRFSRIIFIDDKMKNIQSVFKVCKELEIPCTCVEYTKMKHMKIRTVDFETERKRFDDFIKTKQWKSDPED